MQASFIIALVAPDHPGIVNELSALLAEHQASWQDSRMAQLSGQFAGVLQVHLSTQRVASLEAQLNLFEQKHQIKLMMLPAATEVEQIEYAQYQCTVVGQDRIGFIEDISQAIRSVGANIEELSSHTQEIPMYSGSVFHAQLQIALPTEVSDELLLEALEAADNSFMIDLSPLGETEASSAV